VSPIATHLRAARAWLSRRFQPERLECSLANPGASFSAQISGARTNGPLPGQPRSRTTAKGSVAWSRCWRRAHDRCKTSRAIAWRSRTFSVRSSRAALRNSGDRRTPPDIRHAVRPDFRIGSNAVVLFGSRPAFRPPHEWRDHGIAKFRFVVAANERRLSCQFRDLKWRACQPRPSARDFETVPERSRSRPDRDILGVNGRGAVGGIGSAGLRRSGENYSGRVITVTYARA